MSRTYGQFCSIARALDRLGNRWTLLLIRELLVGPKRFRDLEAGLPGIGANLLSARLKTLESEGIIQRVVLPPPAGVPAYELAEMGQELEPVLLALARWGQRYIDTGYDGDYVRGEWAVVALKASFRSEAALGLQAVYELRMGEESIHLDIDNGRLTAGLGPALKPDVLLTGDLNAFVATWAGDLDLLEAIADGRISIRGDSELLVRFGDLFPSRQG